MPKGENENKNSTYLENQEPLRTGTFKERMDTLKTHLTPAPQAAVLPAAGPVAAVAAGAPNFIGPASGSNMVQVNQATGTNLHLGLTPMTPTTPTAPSTPITSSHPLQQPSFTGSSVMTVATAPAAKSLTARQIAMEQAKAAKLYLEQQKATGKMKKAPI